MRKKDVIVGVGAATEAEMRHEGFTLSIEKDSGLFTRRNGDVVQGFRLRPVKNRYDLSHEISCVLSVRFNAIEDLLRPYLVKDYGGVAPPADMVTLGEGLLNLYSQFDFVTRWWQLRISDESDFAKAGRRVYRDFRKYALPWFRAYQTMDQLEAAYRGPKESWPGGWRFGRFQNLLAIAALKGETARFEALAEEALRLGTKGNGGAALPDIVEGLRLQLGRTP